MNYFFDSLLLLLKVFFLAEIFLIIIL